MAAIAALRQLRLTGPEIAETLGMPLSTVSAVLTRIGLGSAAAGAAEPANRYERQRPGELVHIDVKKLGRIGGAGPPRQRRPAHAPPRGIGWEFVHVGVDDATRLAYVEVLADEKGPTASASSAAPSPTSPRYGIRVERVLTDNGSCYRALVHALACRTLGIRHLRTRPYRPRTNGKAERFIRTLLDGWAYGAIYRTRGTHRRPRRLARLVQPPQTTRHPQPPTAHDPPPQLMNNVPGTNS